MLVLLLRLHVTHDAHPEREQALRVSRVSIPTRTSCGHARAFIVRAATGVAFQLDCLRQGRRSCKLGEDVAVRSAGDKGSGIFALRKIEQGELIGRYDGQLLTDEAFQSSKSSGLYAFGMANGWVVDGEQPRNSNWLRFLNHSVRRANCNSDDLWEEGGPLGLAAIIIVAKQDINEGDELMFDYGDEYWSILAPYFSLSAPSRFAIDYL